MNVIQLHSAKEVSLQLAFRHKIPLNSIRAIIDNSNSISEPNPVTSPIKMKLRL